MEYCCTTPMECRTFYGTFLKGTLLLLKGALPFTTFAKQTQIRICYL